MLYHQTSHVVLGGPNSSYDHHQEAREESHGSGKRTIDITRCQETPVGSGSGRSYEMKEKVVAKQYKINIYLVLKLSSARQHAARVDRLTE
jgi:hypothetical protein